MCLSGDTKLLVQHKHTNKISSESISDLFLNSYGLWVEGEIEKGEIEDLIVFEFYPNGFNDSKTIIKSTLNHNWPVSNYDLNIGYENRLFDSNLLHNCLPPYLNYFFFM